MFIVEFELCRAISLITLAREKAEMEKRKVRISKSVKTEKNGNGTLEKQTNGNGS